MPAVVVEPGLAGSGEALPAGLADLFSSSVVFVVGGDCPASGIPAQVVA